MCGPTRNLAIAGLRIFANQHGMASQSQKASITFSKSQRADRSIRSAKSIIDRPPTQLPIQREERGERAAALLLPEHGQPQGVPLRARRRHPVGAGDVAVVPRLPLGPRGGGGRGGLGPEGVLLPLLEAGDLRDVAPVLGDDALAEHRVEPAVEAVLAVVLVEGLGEGLGPLARQGHHVGEGGEAARLGGAGRKVVRVVRVYKNEEDRAVV